MSFKIGWISKLRRGKIHAQLKAGMEKAQARDYLAAISNLTLALENIDTEGIYIHNKISSARLEPVEEFKALNEEWAYCDARRAVAYRTLIIILLDMGDREKAIEYFKKLIKVDPKGAEDLNASLRTQGVQL